MKKFTFLMLAFLCATTMWSQVTNWQDFTLFTKDCAEPVPNQIIELNDPNFSFIAGFGSNVAGLHVWGQIQRTVTFEFTDFDGGVIKTEEFVSILSEWENFELNSSHLTGLPGSSAIYVNMIVCYEYINDEAGEIHNLTLFENQAELCGGSFQEVGEDGFCCEISRVLCFYTPLCGGIMSEIEVSNNVLKASIFGNPEEYSYVWTFEEDGTDDIIVVGQTQTISADPCLDGIYCVTVTELATGCKKTDCVPIFQPFDCLPCLIADSVTGLKYAIGMNGDLIFSWDPTAGAVEYTLIIAINDPFCCPLSEGTSEVIRIETTETSVSYNLSGKGRSCFSWQVIAECDGNGSASSPRICSNYWKANDEISIRASEFEGTQLHIFPNPTSTTTTLTLENFSDESAAINVYSLEGRLMSTETVLSNQQERTLQHEIGQNLPIGIYMVQVVSENVNISKKIVVQK